MILYLLMKLFPDRRNSSGTWIRDVFFGSLITTGYGASVVYYLRHNMRSLMLMYWEWVLGYVALFTLLGFLWVRSVRSSESSKANVRSAVLWAIRSAGIIGIYNASASPMGSLVLLAVALTLYVLYAFNKHVLSQFQRKKQKEQ